MFSVYGVTGQIFSGTLEAMDRVHRLARAIDVDGSEVVENLRRQVRDVMTTPVVGESGHLPGFVSRSDVLRALRVCYTEAEQRDAKQAVEAARDHVEADLHAEMRQLRGDIRALQTKLSERVAR